MAGCLVVAWLILAAGCGGGDENLGTVTGTVLLDGQPLSGALLTFTPKGAGSPSVGRTDAQGRYSLYYTRDLQGAVLGEHTITITTQEEPDPEAEPPKPGSPEKLPAKYHTKTELSRTVERGRNTIDFELNSQG